MLRRSHYGYKSVARNEMKFHLDIGWFQVCQDCIVISQLMFKLKIRLKFFCLNLVFCEIKFLLVIIYGVKSIELKQILGSN